MDINTGNWRFTFGFSQLADGIDLMPLAIGLFGVTEVIANLVRPESERTAVTHKLSGLWPTRQELREAAPAALRGTALGSFLGLLPGGGAVLSSFAAYTLEKKISSTPERFGHGAVAGLAAPEAANNAGAQTSFVPMLTLGVPGNAVMAVMIGAMTMHGIQPGPQVMTERPELFWGLIASMLIGNIILVILNLPLIGLWVQLLRIPYRMLYLVILLFCSLGVYTVNNSTFDVILTALFGGIGYLLYRLRCEPAPLLLGFVLGPMMEENFRRTMLISGGDPMILFHRPLSLALIILTAGLFLMLVMPSFSRTRAVAFQEADL
jgi:TctA family transporter